MNQRAISAAVKSGLFLVVLAFGGSAPAATISPISVTGFNRDFVVEASATNDATNHYRAAVTATMDAGTGIITSGTNDTTFYEHGLPGNTSGGGLPAGAGTATSVLDGSTFTLQPYAGNNVLQYHGPGAASPATLSFTNTTTDYSTLAFYGAAGATGTSSTKTTNVVIHFSDGTADATVSNINNIGQDWFGGTGAALNNLDRVHVTTGVFDNLTTAPSIYESTVNLTTIVTTTGHASDHPISGVTFSYNDTNTGANAVIFAVSGTVIPEPCSLGFLGIAAAGLMVRRRRLAI